MFSTPKSESSTCCYSYIASHLEDAATVQSGPTQKGSSSSECSGDTLCSDLDDSVSRQGLFFKNTYTEDGDCMEQSRTPRTSSLPGILLRYPMTLTPPTMQELHDCGECRPCHLSCSHRCRDIPCNFCHPCPPEVLEKAFQEKQARMRARRSKARMEFEAKKAYQLLQERECASMCYDENTLLNAPLLSTRAGNKKELNAQQARRICKRANRADKKKRLVPDTAQCSMTTEPDANRDANSEEVADEPKQAAVFANGHVAEPEVAEI